ncbi:sigma-70 family RNA polymerase sigma factor [Acidocella sp.]|uniref:sigma-70 family RNA polymerase sigma factor n=1 Tax=Acidocella sp. TaxID=50710 RepID=UPI003D08C6EC
MTEPGIPDLMQDAAAGDRAAFSAVMRYALPRAWRLAMRMLGNQAEAEEVAQEAMLRLWRHAGSFDPRRAPFDAWLTRITANLALDRLRMRQRAGVAVGLDDAIPSTTPNPEEALGRAARMARIEVALQTLPDRQRAAVVLVHYEGLSGVQAAQSLGMTPKALEGLLYRGLGALRRLLLDEGEAE